MTPCAEYGHHRKFELMIHQDKPIDFVRQNLKRHANGTNWTPVTWTLQFQEIPQIAYMGPEAAVQPLHMMLCYDFQFAGHKAAEVGQVIKKFALKSLDSRGRHSTSSNLDQHRNSCVSHITL